MQFGLPGSCEHWCPKGSNRGLSANQNARALISMMARSKCSNQRPDTLMQDRSLPARRNHLQRTAGPYMWVKSYVLTLGLPLPLYPDQRTSSDRFGWSGSCQQRTYAPRQTASVAISVVDDFSARSQRGAKHKPWSGRALGAAEQTKQNRAIGSIDGLQPVFYRLTAAAIEHEREMASHGARAGLLIEAIQHRIVVVRRARALLADALQARTRVPHPRAEAL